MLIQFTVENHRSIKNSAVISFAASKDKSFEEYLLHPDAKKTLLPTLAIYGANAAGKSNVLHAMMTMKEMVIYLVHPRFFFPLKNFGCSTGQVPDNLHGQQNFCVFCVSGV